MFCAPWLARGETPGFDPSPVAPGAGGVLAPIPPAAIAI